MGRGKLTMEYITTEKARKSSFKKRKDGLVKKIRELSTLCGIDACLIVYGLRNNDGSPPEVHTWPKEHKEVENVLRKYELKKNESSNKHYNLMDFYGNQICKINEQIVKTRRELAKAKFAKSMEVGLEGMSVDELKGMVNAVDKKIDTVTSCIEVEKEKLKLSRGIEAVELMKFEDDRVQTYLGEQVTEQFKPMQLSVSDFEPYLPMQSLSDTFLAQNNYQVDVTDDYIPMLNANERCEYILGASSFGQFRVPNCEPQYFQTSLYTADPLKGYGMGYPAAQHQQQSVLTTVLQGNCFQPSDCCCGSGDCYGNFCWWQQEKNSR